jgi:hypothetical protein
MPLIRTSGRLHRGAALATAVVAATAISLVGAPAAAGAQSQPLVAARAGGSATDAADLALNRNVNIVDWSGAVQFNRTTMSASLSGQVPQRCNRTDAAFTITNRTARFRTITVDGAAFGTIAASTVGLVCLWGSGRATIPFGIVGSGSTLAVKVG